MQLCSEEFNLSVKRLSRGISGMIDEIVEYFSLSISNGCGNSTEILVPKVLHYLSSLYMFHILFTFLLSLYEAKEVRALQGFHHSIAVSVGSRMSGGHAVQNAVFICLPSLLLRLMQRKVTKIVCLSGTGFEFHLLDTTAVACDYTNATIEIFLWVEVFGVFKVWLDRRKFGCGRDRRRGRSLQANYAPPNTSVDGIALRIMASHNGHVCHLSCS